MVPGPERRLAAVLAADMVGYSRLMEVVETGLTSESDSDRTSAGLLPAPLVSR